MGRASAGPYIIRLSGGAGKPLLTALALQFPLPDSYNAFDAAHMVVHQERIDRS